MLKFASQNLYKSLQTILQMTIEDRIKQAETRQCKIVFPGSENEHGTLFGGTALQWMDEVAYITALRFTRVQVVTILVENVRFLLPMKSGSIIEIVGKVVRHSLLKVEVQIEIFTESMFGFGQQKAIEASFVFASIDGNHKPQRMDFTN